MDHIVILREPYASAIAVGRKRAEARLSQTRQPPFERVSPGDVLWLRRVGGGFFARAVVGSVVSRSSLTASGVNALRRRFGRRIGAPPSFWASRRRSRYATIIEFASVEPTAIGPDFQKRPGDRRAWIVLPAQPLAQAA